MSSNAFHGFSSVECATSDILQNAIEDFFLWSTRIESRNRDSLTFQTLVLKATSRHTYFLRIEPITFLTTGILTLFLTDSLSFCVAGSRHVETT